MSAPVIRRRFAVAPITWLWVAAAAVAITGLAECPHG